MSAADWNAVRFDPAAGRDHVESYFLKLNEPNGERALWLKATIFASAIEPSRPVAEGWAIAFDRRGEVARHVAVKHALPYAGASFSRERLGVSWSLPPADALLIEPGVTRGAVSLRDDRVAWDLRFAGDVAPIVPLPFEAMYDAKLPNAKLVTPYPDARFDGEVTAFGERWSIDGWRGMQGHNWGRGHAELYAWSHANVWDQREDFVLEGLSARVRVGPVLSPLMTLACVRYRGVRYDFNRPLSIARATGQVTPRRWAFEASNDHARIEGAIEAETSDMVGLYYPNPAGPMTYCLNSKLARARVRFEPRGRPPLTLTSRAAALEIGTRDEAHGVRMAV